MKQKIKQVRAFTLAEVLITLGIIGVVAAMTMPTLMSKYRGHVAVQKLKKVSTTLLQVAQKADYDNGTNIFKNQREGFTPQDSDAALEMFNKYYVPYMDFERVEKGKYGVFGYLKDGVALYFYKPGNPNSWAFTYIYVCLTHKICENINNDEITSDYTKIPDGKTIFTLYVSGQIPDHFLHNSTREQRIEQCKNQTGSPEACTALLFEAGWSVPKDYPIRF